MELLIWVLIPQQGTHTLCRLYRNPHFWDAANTNWRWHYELQALKGVFNFYKCTSGQATCLEHEELQVGLKRGLTTMIRI